MALTPPCGDGGVCCGRGKVAVHHGPLQTIHLTYGDLGVHAARHEIGVDGPLREFYLRSPLDVAGEHDWVTEVGRPIFRSNG
ncbi:hypothetical protein ACFZB9_07310 [Kitasatospora sp. NPDC008050]|uniref:hypothetical protein n=1 Tax=Kitasatospora sp. NPDC008050 TaxID=3364021 RepID=UPI0036EB6E91